MLTDNEILTYYQFSNTKELNLKSLDMEKIIKNGNFENYHQNIVLTIYAILHKYKIVFSKEHKDYRVAVGGFKLRFEEQLEGSSLNFTYRKRKRFMVTEGYWVFDNVDYLYDHKAYYPNNIKNITPKQFEEFFIYLIRGYRMYIKEFFKGDDNEIGRYLQENKITHREVELVMAYYVGKSKAGDIMQRLYEDLGYKVEELYKDYYYT